MLFFVSKNVLQSVDRTNKRTLFSMFFLGAVGYAGSSEFYFISSQHTGTGLAMVLFFSYPILVMLSSWIMQRKRLNLGIIFVLMTMISGLILLQNPSVNRFDAIGIFFGIISAACYAFYVVGSKQITSHAVNSNILTMMVCLGCAFIFLALSISSHNFVLPHSIKCWAYLLALGIIATALPIQLMLMGLKYISSMRASIISVLEPLVTVFVGMLLLDESISHQQLLGAFIILTSALFAQLQKEL